KELDQRWHLAPVMTFSDEVGTLYRCLLVKEGMADVDRRPARGTVDLIVVALEVSLLQRTPKERSAREVRGARDWHGTAEDAPVEGQAAEVCIARVSATEVGHEGVATVGLLLAHV